MNRTALHFGIITPPVSGHLHPFGALGRELIGRGHRVTVFHMADLESRVLEEKLEFVALGASDHPQGTLAASLAALGRLKGLAALRFTIGAVRKTTLMMCRDAPGAIRAAGCDVLLVDQTEPAGGTIADYLRLPFITICNALLMTEEADVPPPFTDWNFHPGMIGRWRNQVGYRISEYVTSPVTKVVREYRVRWSLPVHRRSSDAYSTLCQISQQPQAFDFPRRHLPKNFYYVGPLRRAGGKEAPAFPWDRLNGKPLVYASLGTLQNQREEMFRRFAEACQELPVQLVLTHGGGLDMAAVKRLPAGPLVVPYAPQLEVLEQSALTLTHAGLNTVLDSLTFGVPLVAIPITYEQPAIASRIRFNKVGEVLEFKQATSENLRRTIKKVLQEPIYQERATALKASIWSAGGVRRAADLIESSLNFA